MTFDTIALDLEGSVATLTLNRPDKFNAFSAQVGQELRAALQSVLERGGVRALVLTGAGRAFCSGSDQKPGGPVSPPNDPDRALRDYYTPAFSLLSELNMPTIAAVNGVAAGAGVSLALSCDFVIAARSAYFVASFVNLGLVPDNGASWFLTGALGPARANALLMLGERLPAEQAAQWGLIGQCVDDAELADATKTLATRLAEGPTVAYSLIKRLTRQAPRNSLADQIRLEHEYQGIARATEDKTEAKQAFIEKRKPRFKGR